MSNSQLGKVFIFGSYNRDDTYIVEDLVKPGQTIKALSYSTTHGGKGSNQAISCAMADSETYFAVKLGRDRESEKALSFLTESYIHTVTPFYSDRDKTGSAIILVSKKTGENSIVINAGANESFSPEDVKACFPRILDSNILLTQLENNINATIIALKFAKNNGVTTILNPAPWNCNAKDLFPWVDILTPNRTEAEEIVGFTLETNNDLKKATEIIHELGVKKIIITLGDKGCWFFNGEEHQQFKPFPANVVDTTGAGDAFNGSLAARIANGDSVNDAITYASCFASLSVERVGASNIPSHDLVLSKLKAC